jgi:hypothetical protein
MRSRRAARDGAPAPGEAELAKACDEKLDSTRRHSGEDRAHDRVIRVCRACCMKACRALGHADLRDQSLETFAAYGTSVWNDGTETRRW